ncbi:MAG: ABC transporter permease [Isosphaeraceae bacterium]
MQRFWNTIALALRNPTLHKLRVLLTVLGLIFGVSSVIAMLAIAEGASAEAQRQIAELGATNVAQRFPRNSFLSATPWARASGSVRTTSTGSLA